MPFVKEGYQVEVVTSSFYHMGKTQRSIEDPKYQSFGYKVHFISGTRLQKECFVCSGSEHESF
jgi:hypothetical protein